MANQDTFIDEVTQEVRRDRLFALFRRYGWIALAVVLAIVGGAAWNEWRKAQARATAEARGDAVIAALDLEDARARAAAVAAVAAEGETAALLALLAAAQEAEDGATEAALARLDAVAGDAELPRVYRDLAALKALVLRADDTAPEDRLAALQPLATPGAPYRTLAMEQIALAQVAAGAGDDARATLQEILDDGETPQGLRRRAQQMMVALGGAPDAS